MNHPLTLDRMPLDKAEAQINGGIEWTSAAMTDPSKLAPFFRIPGLMRADGVENLLISRGIQVWSADFPADDWRHVSSDRVYQLAMQRLEAKGKGILLLHDIQARTVAALPKIIRELKARGYRIVHVVPATAEQPATPTTPVEWLLHPPTETTPIARWPAVPNFVFAQTETLAAPSLADLDAQTAHQPLLPRKTMALANVAATLPVPGRDLFAIPEGSIEVLLSTTLSRRAATRLAMAAETPRAAKGKAGKSRAPRTAHAVHGTPKHAAEAEGTAAKSTAPKSPTCAAPDPCGEPEEAPAVESLLSHDVGDAEQHDQRQEEQVHIGLDLAVAPQPGDVNHDLLAHTRSARAVIERGLKALGLGFQLLDLLVEVERP